MLQGVRAIDVCGELGWLAGRLLADLGADVVKVERPDAAVGRVDWQAYNVNKRVLRLDPETAAGRAALDALLAGTDILLESAAPDSAVGRFLDPDRLQQRYPHLVHVSVTPFGRTGPHAHWEASDLEIMAAGGAMSLAGEPGGKPLRVTVPQARAWAGSHAAAGALIALLHRDVSGRGQHVDVSAQAAVLVALAHAPTFVDISDKVPTRCGAFITGRTITGAQLRAFWPCRDGYINFVLYGGPAGRRSNQQLAAWMQAAGCELGALAEVDFAAFDPKRLDQQQVDLIEAPIARFFLTLTKREFLEGASAREMLGYPVSTMADIAADPQLRARDFWADIPGEESAPVRHCGPFALIDGKRSALRHAPGTPVGFDELVLEWSAVRPTRAEPAAESVSP